MGILKIPAGPPSTSSLLILTFDNKIMVHFLIKEMPLHVCPLLYTCTCTIHVVSYCTVYMYMYNTCSQLLYRIHVHVQYMQSVIVPYTCTCTIHAVSIVPYTCTCTIHESVIVPCTCTIHSVIVPYTCTCTIHAVSYCTVYMYMYNTCSQLLYSLLMVVN